MRNHIIYQLAVKFVAFIIIHFPCGQSEEQLNVTLLSPSPALLYLNVSSTDNASVFIGNVTIQTVTRNFTVNVSSVVNPNRSSSEIMNASASMISQITGSTKTENNTFFVEFKTEAFKWSSDLTKENHNTFIDTANKIVQIIDNLYTNMSYFKGSYVIGFRDEGYVSVKLQFNGGDINNLDIMIQFLRDGGGELVTDKVYLKLSKIADCIIAYINSAICDCTSMSYKRQITCVQPEIHGGEKCPEQCYTGHLIAGYKSCSWDDLDAFKCVASRHSQLNIMLLTVPATLLKLI